MLSTYPAPEYKIPADSYAKYCQILTLIGKCLYDQVIFYQSDFYTDY